MTVVVWHRQLECVYVKLTNDTEWAISRLCWCRPCSFCEWQEIAKFCGCWHS